MPPADAARPYALVLAAGAGSRFGGAKLLAGFRGRPLVAHVAGAMAEVLASGTLAGGVAVIPPGDTGLSWHLDTAGLRLVENPRAATGVATSLQCGLAALAALEEPRAGAALVVLADQPLLRPEVVSRLVAEWRRTGRTTRPRYAARREEPGHPVLLDRADWPLARQLTGDRGLGALLAGGAANPVVIDVPGENPDVDTPADLTRLEGAG